MVTIAIAGASSGLAREILDKLVASGKHDIKALVRKVHQTPPCRYHLPRINYAKIKQNPSDFPQLKNVEWIQTDFSDKAELVNILKGVNTVLCFFAVHLDPGCENQKRLINAAIEVGVKRFAPSEWGPLVPPNKTIKKVTDK
ncbi:hypothetical protein ACHAPO_007062 [Fusarium lateritium]